MGFDNSRDTYDSWKDYCGVVMQQGRVQMDSDWNEWLAELDRRIRAGTLDTLGRAVYPSTTPSAFKITTSSDAKGNHIQIGAGRMYVDGLLAENHGPPSSASWDPALDEMSGSPLVAGTAAATLDYTDQPYLPGAGLPAGNGPFLAYLDVWRRPISYLQDRTLVDKAVGVDTTGRLQTAWQVKLLDVSKVAGVNCDTADADIPGWQALIQPSAGQLTNGVVPSSSSGPCCLSPNTGYTGMENQFYRVEIHRRGIPAAVAAAPTAYPLPAGSTTATFKWSRDNASVVTSVTGIAAVTNTLGNPASQLTVESLGRDRVLGFAPGNWIEITDDVQELNAQPGELHQIDSIDFTARTITLDSTVNAASFPVTKGATDPGRHTRICRWDQAGKVYESDGVTVWVDLGAPGSTGDIPIPPAGTTLILEQGITVSFGLNPAGGSFHSADFWTFAARTADGTLEPLVQAYPRGIHHHFARLSVVTFPTTATDCRIPWPPAGGDGCQCCCTAVVKPADLASGSELQGIIDRYQNLGTPTTICLMPGTYRLSAPLRFNAAHSNIRLQGCGSGAVVIEGLSDRRDAFADGLVVLSEVANIVLRGLRLAIPAAAPAFKQFAGVSVNSLDPDVQRALTNLRVWIGVRSVSCSGLVIEDCEFDLAPNRETAVGTDVFPFGVGILATGACSDWRIAGNVFTGGGNFTAGVLLASSVIFGPPIKPRVAPRPAAEASGPGTAIAPEQIGTGPTTLSGSPAIPQAQALLAAGTSTPDLASNGGRVLPATLDEAVFTRNTFSNLTIAVVSLSELGIVEFSENVVDGCLAGAWFLLPTRADRIVSDPRNLALIGLSIALGYPMPSSAGTSDASWVHVPRAAVPVRTFTGREAYTDSTGSVWLPDAGATNLNLAISGGSPFTATDPVPTITGALPGSDDQTLYRSERFGTFTYTYQHLPRGFYSLTLKFAEIRPAAGQKPGERIFDVAINNQQVLTNFDIVADVGGIDVADDWLFDNIVPDSSGQITVQFTGTSLGPITDAKVSAASLIAQWSADFLATETLQQNQGTGSTVQEFPNFFLQLQQLAQQGFVDLASDAGQIRVTDNEMRGLSASAIILLADDEVQNPKVCSLLMTGNRLAATIPFQQVSRSENTLARLTASANVSQKAVGVDGAAAALSFRCVVGIFQVTRCALSANVIVNEAPSSLAFERASFRLSLLLYDGFLPSPAATNPQPEILVASNLFQGRALIIPSRFPPNSTIPAPMNSWDFLNSVFP